MTNLDIQNLMELSAQMDVWQVWSSGRVVACHTRGTSTSGSNPTGGFILYSKKNAIITSYPTSCPCHWHFDNTDRA